MSETEPTAPPKEMMPDTIELGELELNAMESMFADLSVNITKQAQLNQMFQQVQQAIQQNQAEAMGNGKAIETFIKTIVKTRGLIGQYVYDKEKKLLVKNPNVKQ